ncbi:porin, partial [Escherichia coli]|uniref:porin n=1 Tax=Escherichia coli TaxID=562 RepID=UPI003FCECF04
STSKTPSYTKSVSWQHHQNMSTFVDYKINLIDKSDFTKASGVATDDIVAVGMVYQF